MQQAGLSNTKRNYILILLAAIGLAIKYIFVDLGIDAEYQVVMAYRLATGEVMFQEMWEAHQTSAFLCAIFVKLYLLLLKTTTGIVLYLQIVSVMIDAAISCFLYRVVNKYLDNRAVACAMAWVFFVVSPKDVPMAEFANMQLWSCLLLCLWLFVYHVTRKKCYLVLAALSLCAAVLAYPSCVILLVGIGFLNFYYREKKEFLIITAVCVVTGMFYIGFLLTNMSVSELLFAVENMLAIEPTHTVGMGEKFIAYAKDATKIAVLFGIVYGISYLIAQIISRLKKQNKENSGILMNSLFLGQILLISFYTAIRWRVYMRYSYSLVFLAVIVVGLYYAKRLSGAKRYFYVCGTVIAIFNFVATLILTDLELVGSIPYLLIAVVAAFLPIGEVYQMIDAKSVYANLIKVLLVCGFLLLTVRNAYIIRPMYGQIQPLTAVGGIVKEGPAIGIISDYMGVYMQNETLKEWDQYVEEGSNIYMIGRAIDTLGYLYSDTNIAAPSVMSTPAYNEYIPKYWEINPEKYPDVIIASCWYGSLDQGLLDNEWILNWIEEEYQPQYQIDGKYWRYYFKEQPSF